MLKRLSVAIALVAVAAAPARAQQRPLVTEDPETIGGGLILIEGGVELDDDQEYPASGLTGNLWRIGTVGMSIGLGSISELQFDWGVHDRLDIEERVPAPLSHMLTIEGDTTTSVEDLIVATKVRMVSEAPGRPAIGVRFATKLPNAGNESGLGLDTTDFSAAFLIGKTVRSVRVVGNAGLAILADPTRGDRQNDLLTYGVSVARAVTAGAELVGEVNGRADLGEDIPPPGTESRAVMRVGARYTAGPGRIDGAFLAGFTSHDPSWGFTAGFTYVFNAFRVP
jgi:hypothetical protein